MCIHSFSILFFSLSLAGSLARSLGFTYFVYLFVYKYRYRYMYVTGMIVYMYGNLTGTYITNLTACLEGTSASNKAQLRSGH